MFDAKLENGHQMKKIVTALKELIDQASWDLTEEGIQLQSMDSSHVALVQMMLKCENFEVYRCNEAFNMGLNMANLNKVFGAFTSGSLSIQCEDDSETVKFIFEDEKNNKSQKYELRLMDLDTEQLGIPEQEYEATFTMPSSEFSRIVKDLLVMGESVTISVTKGDVMFKAEGDIGKADITIKKNESIGGSNKKKNKDKSSKNKKKNSKKSKVKKEADANSDAEEEVEAMDEDNENEEDEESEEESDNEPSQHLELDVKENIELSFATQYLKKFTAAGPLAQTVSVSLSKDVPMVITYEIEDLGHIKYFLAPKIDDDDDE
jgi:proliferating cell nuclear antigen